VECPICVSLLCEPVLTPCNHRFCKNCLGKVQRFQGPACPICRAPCRVPAETLEEDASLERILKQLDPEYQSRREEAEEERETQRIAVPVRPSVPGIPSRIQVSGAGCEEVNGTYVTSFVSSYRGPTVYQKPSSRIFIFRWQQRHWVIAHLSANESFRDKANWYYKAPSFGLAIPAQGGWSPITNGCGELPAPVLHVDTLSTTGAQIPQQRPPMPVPLLLSDDDAEVPRPNHNQCLPTRCAIM